MKLLLKFYLAPNQISCKFLAIFWPTEPVDFSRTEPGSKQQGEPHSPTAVSTDSKSKLGQTTSQQQHQQQLQMCFLQHGYSTDDYSDLEPDSEDDDNSSDVDIVGDTKLYQLT